jgi:hypothetical protein
MEWKLHQLKIAKRYYESCKIKVVEQRNNCDLKQSLKNHIVDKYGESEVFAKVIHFTLDTEAESPVCGGGPTVKYEVFCNQKIKIVWYQADNRFEPNFLRVYKAGDWVGSVNLRDKRDPFFEKEAKELAYHLGYELDVSDSIDFAEHLDAFFSTIKIPKQLKHY